MANTMFILAVVGILMVIVLGFFITIYNSLIRLRNNISKSWSNIDVLLKQRHDELENLLSSVKGYMKHEREVLEEVTKARAMFLSAKSIREKAEADRVAGLAVKSLFAVAESYPKLRASENFLAFQQRISELENQIADRREFYNDSVTTYNTRIQQVPYSAIAGMLHYSPMQLFQAEESERASFKVSSK